MLRSFRVTNHRSIRAEQELQLTPVYDKTRPVLPIAAIFGANAAGKSNLLDALRFMQHAVRRSYAEWEPGTGIPRAPFALDPAAAYEPSVFVVELLLDGVRHIYGFEIDDERVREEWLYAYPHNRRRVIFDREGQQIRLGSTLADNRSKGALLAELTRDNALFVTVAAHANLADVMPLYGWFRTGVTTVDADHQADHETLVNRLLPTAPEREAVIALLRAADLGISDVIVDPSYAQLIDEVAKVRRDLVEAERTSESRAQTKLLLERLNSIPSPLRFVHDETGAVLDLNEQSHGTRVWMAMIDHLLDVLKDGHVLAIDEIDSGLHPRLTVRLIELFKNPASNKHSAQLVVTSHDATLLGRELGEDILPRDAVWFVKKDRKGETSLYALADFKPRKDENTERRYLFGSYGAVPRLFDVEFEDAIRLHEDLVGGRVAS